MSKKRLLPVILSVILVLATALTGCGKKESGDNTDKSAPQVINVATAQDIASLDSTKIADSSSNTIAQETQDGLVRLEGGKIVPAGAETWETSEDGLTWTFHLRDYSYSDGTKVSAKDYEYAVKRVFDPVTACPNAGIFYVIKGGQDFNTSKGSREDVGVKAVDEKTLEFTLTQPTPYFIQLMNFVSLIPVRQDLVEKYGEAYGTDPAQVVYSGPFVVDQWVKGSKIVLKKNDKYWDASNVKLDTVNINIVAEEGTRQQLFDSKGLDLIQNVKGEYAQKLDGVAKTGEITSLNGYYPSNGYIAFNNKDPQKIFTNAKVRLAFSIAIDREGYVKNVTKKDQAAYGLVPYGTNNGDVIYREAVEEPLKKVISQDPKELLKQGLTELGLDPAKQIEVTFLQGNANADTKIRGEFYQSQWEEKLGVKVKIDTASDGATFNKMIMNGTYQVAQTGWGADYNDPMTFMGLFLTGDGNNSAFFTNAEYDELVKKASVEPDMEKRLEMFKRAEEVLIAEEAGIAPLTFNVATNYIQSYVKGLQIQAGGPAYELKYVSIEK
ncbi:MAG: oligopeptide/dipeptide transporter, oligopeptide/dipeptide-binding protein [Clostridiales bacterium]|jgi:oligopeptide transport system substrate-binding protein|nr:oligopeptide/dipeptide transporter, oligopeptide/dipeptide-binding protein [Clostridiales bacterium]